MLPTPTASADRQTKLSERAELLSSREIAYIYCPELAEMSMQDALNISNTDCYDTGSQSDCEASALSSSSLLNGPLLSVEGERRLFLKLNSLLHHANQLRVRINPNRPARKSIERIETCLEAAQRARSTIVEANTRLVASIAHKFCSSQLEYDELLSEGNMILVNAVDKFDFSRGFRFSTYATHAIQRHFYRLMQRRQRRKSREVSTPTEILSDIVSSREQEAPLDHLVAEALISRFDDCLDEREAVILRERFGLNGGDSSETLKVVADKVGLSKERVRQLQMRAIEKLQDLAIQMKLRLEPSF